MANGLIVLVICVITVLSFKFGYILAKLRYDWFTNLDNLLNFFDENFVTEENVDEFDDKIGILFDIAKNIEKTALTVRRASKFMRDSFPDIAKHIEEIKQKKQ